MNIPLLITGIMAIAASLILGNAIPWIEQSSFLASHICIGDLHFEESSLEEFQKCVKPNIDKIERIQMLDAVTSFFSVLGGICTGISFTRSNKKN